MCLRVCKLIAVEEQSWSQISRPLAVHWLAVTTIPVFHQTKIKGRKFVALDGLDSQSWDLLIPRQVHISQSHADFI